MGNCLKSGKNGSCPRLAVEGSLFCERHTNESDRVQTYLIEDAALRASFERQSHANLYSLREEVCLIRAMINDRLNICRCEAERLVAYREIGTWIGTVDKLVNSLNKLEKETSQILTKETLLTIGAALVTVISEELKKIEGHEKVIDAISVRIIPLLENATNKNE